MKIMWLCNAPIPQVAEACKISNTIHEGWLISIATELERRENIQFVFVMPNREVPEGVHYTEKGNSLYILVHQKDKNSENLVPTFEEILKKVNPDIVHIWGTEYIQSWAMVRAAKNCGRLENVVVSMQGLVHRIGKHYMGGIPGKYQMIPSFRDIIRKDTLKDQERNMIQRGCYEKETLSTIKHVIGRTFWDRACAESLNSEITYHFNNETLREAFYTSEWSYRECKKHSIFVTQSHYPIKGFHYLLEAVAILKEKYDQNIYMKGFLRNLYLRKSCYNCSAKGFTSGSDITMGDSWGIQNEFKEFDDDKGCSIIFINTKQGQNLFNSVQENFEIKKIDDRLVKYNKALVESVFENKNRTRFFNDLDKIDIEENINNNLYDEV